jgi:hypothetical protein
LVDCCSRRVVVEFDKEMMNTKKFLELEALISA